MEALASSTHYVAARWKWTTVALVPLLTALMVWAAVEVVKNYLSGKGDPNIWVTGFVLAVLASLTVVFLASVFWAFRARIVLAGDRMAVRGLMTTRVISEQQVEGFRWIKGQLHLYLRNREWPVSLAYFERPQVIQAWVFSHARDLAAQGLAEEDEAIRRDPTLGLREAQKEARLAKLRWIIRNINVLAYIGAGVGVLNALFVHQDTAEKAAAAVLVSIPIVLVLLALRNRGHIRVDYQEGSRYPQIFSGSMACGVAVALMALFDDSTLIGNEFYRWFLPLAAAKGLLWLFIDSDRIRMLHARGRFVSSITVVCMVILPAFWVGGSIYQVNKQLDNSTVSWNSSEVIDKRASKGRTVSRYTIKVTPWNSAADAPLELNVSRGQFKQLAVGMQIEIGVRRGALAIPWVAEIRLKTESGKGSEVGS